MSIGTYVVRDSGVIVTDAASTGSESSGGGGGGGITERADTAGFLTASIVGDDTVYAVAPLGGVIDADVLAVDRGDEVELSTDFGAYEDIVALMSAANMGSTWDFTYDAAHPDFGTDSTALLDGQASSTLVLSGATTLNTGPVGPFLGKAVYTSGGTSFDNLQSQADQDFHQGQPVGAWVAFRLNNTTDTRALILFGSYGGSSSFCEVRTVSGNLMVVEPGTTTGVVLGTTASFVGTTTLLNINQAPRYAGLGGGAVWDVHWRRDTDAGWSSATHTPAARAGRSSERVYMGGFTPNIYRLPSAVLYHVSVKTTGCITESHRIAFAQMNYML